MQLGIKYAVVKASVNLVLSFSKRSADLVILSAALLNIYGKKSLQQWVYKLGITNRTGTDVQNNVARRTSITN